MVLAVASGKGGTGKTTIATSLALVASKRGPVCFLDCDVEAPNAALFLVPQMREHKEVGLLLPVVNEPRCTHCGRCAEACQFHAIAVLGTRTLLLPELCHGCGSCTMVCPEQAITERLHVTGILERGETSTGIDFARGVMNVGEAMAVPIIRELTKWCRHGDEVLEIRDAPPGASCSVVETIRTADFVLLVTEPTPFGLHDLRLAAEIAREVGIPSAVIVNRDGIGDEGVEAYCAKNDLPILLRIPMERRLAEALARGRTLIETAPEYQPAFQAMLDFITAKAAA